MTRRRWPYMWSPLWTALVVGGVTVAAVGMVMALATDDPLMGWCWVGVELVGLVVGQLAMLAATRQMRRQADWAERTARRLEAKLWEEFGRDR